MTQAQPPDVHPLGRRARAHWRRWRDAALATGLAIGLAAQAAPAGPACDKPVYLAFETGSMQVAPLVGVILQRQQVHATFFAAADRTLDGGDAMDGRWAAWWAARGREGHDFVSLTYDRVSWLGDERSVVPAFRVQPQLGAFAGRRFTWDAARYCDNITRAADRLAYVTGQKARPLFRAPGGRVSQRLAAAAQACGYRHVDLRAVPFPPAGSEAKGPTERQIEQTLARIQPGDMMLGHLGVWTREVPAVPLGLDALISGLKAQGFCFRSVSEHPGYASRPATPQ